MWQLMDCTKYSGSCTLALQAAHFVSGDDGMYRSSLAMIACAETHCFITQALDLFECRDDLGVLVHID